MNAKQTLFVAEYRKDLNATQAAIRAGYHPKMAAQLLANPSIQAAITEKTEAQIEKADLSAERTLEEMRRLAFSNVQDLFDANGDLRPIHTLNREQAACISSLEVIVKNAAAGDGHTDIVHKVKVWDKTRTLEMLGKHFALLTERVHHTADEALIEGLKSGRKRASARE
jgi:phage terminase small subunit